jgi:starch phosphorylase
MTEEMKASRDITDVPYVGRTSDDLVHGIQRHYLRTFGQHKPNNSVHYKYRALACTIRDRLMEDWKNTKEAHEERDKKRVYYLSLEFLMGRALGNAVLNLGLDDETAEALHMLGLDLEEVFD